MVAELPNSLRAADPSTLRRLGGLPAWATSLALHVMLFVALATLTLRGAKGLPSEQTLDVGIVLESGTESEDPRVEEGPPAERPNPGELEALTRSLADHGPPEPTEPQADPLPEIEADTTVLATAGSAMRVAREAIAEPPSPRGGGRARTRFFHAESVGESFVFVIDRSASMAHRDALGRAKREVLGSIEKLGPENTFQVIFYNTGFERLLPGEPGLVPATRANIQRAAAALARISASGGTEHNPALLEALRLQPEVIYFLTDADMMSRKDATMLTETNRQLRRPATLYTIEFGNGPNIAEENPLRLLARDNDGSYNYVDIRGSEGGGGAR